MYDAQSNLLIHAFWNQVVAMQSDMFGFPFRLILTGIWVLFHLSLHAQEQFFLTVCWFDSTTHSNSSRWWMSICWVVSRHSSRIGSIRSQICVLKVCKRISKTYQKCGWSLCRSRHVTHIKTPRSRSAICPGEFKHLQIFTRTTVTDPTLCMHDLFEWTRKVSTRCLRYAHPDILIRHTVALLPSIKYIWRRKASICPKQHTWCWHPEENQTWHLDAVKRDISFMRWI